MALFRIALSYILDEQVVNGVNSSLELISEVNEHVDEELSFWGIQLLIVKTSYLYRSEQIREVDFAYIDRCIDNTELTKDEIREIGSRYYNVKRMYF